MLAWQFYAHDQDAVDTIPYNPNFVQFVATGQVTEAEICEEMSGRQYIVGQRREIVRALGADVFVPAHRVSGFHGQTRADMQTYEHAHESPPVMLVSDHVLETLATNCPVALRLMA